MTSVEAPTRRELILAQRAIFENQDREEAAGVTEESHEYLELHERYYELADQLPRWRRRLVWRTALWEHTGRPLLGLVMIATLLVAIPASYALEGAGTLAYFVCAATWAVVVGVAAGVVWRGGQR